MANPEQLKVLLGGVQAWNGCRLGILKIPLDLSKADLTGADLTGADLTGADLTGADLRGADLREANLREANLYEAKMVGTELIEANLTRANLSEASLHGANLTRANLSEASLHGASLREANLRGADLSDAFLNGANLSEASLHGASLREANLRGADLSDAFLNGADLSEASLYWATLTKATLTKTNLTGATLSRADLISANLSEADLTETILNRTHFCFTSLASVKGLPTCRHKAPSSLDYATLMASGPLPEVFLCGCGMSDDFIRYLPSFWSQPIQFYSCFISYSHADKQFARRLHDTLQGKGIRCWLDEKQLLPGDHIHKEVDEAVRLWDKVLLCCSKASLTSWWVDKEVSKALQKEEQLWKERGNQVLKIIPLNLDGYYV